MMNVRCAKRISIISCDSLYLLADNLPKIRIIKSAVNDALKSFGHDCCKILNIRPVSNLEGLAGTICFVFPAKDKLLGLCLVDIDTDATIGTQSGILMAPEFQYVSRDSVFWFIARRPVAQL